EARVNLSAAIAHATHMNDERPTVAGEAVTLTGGLSFERPADDPLLEGEYALVRRTSQTCAWVEKKARQKGQPPSYRKGWVSEVPDSALFASAGHDNQAGVFGSKQSVGSVLRIGTLAVGDPTDFEGAEIIAPALEQVRQARSVDEEWVYLAADRACSQRGGAAIGDQRLSFAAMRAGDLVTGFGRLEGKRLLPHRGRLVISKGTRAELLTHVEASRDGRTWMFRGVGALLLWIALYFIIRPALDLVAWIPIVGSLARGAASAATMILAAALTLGFVFRGWGMTFFTKLYGSLVG
ncbi:MAG: hypothetical protein ACI9WU_003415, partial [Myxococcota bacterium]